MGFESAKTLGAVGSILVVLTVVPYAGAILGLIGIVLILATLHFLSDYYEKKEIFRNALIALIVAMVGMTAAFMMSFTWLLAATVTLPPQYIKPPHPDFSKPILMTLLPLIMFFATYLVSAIFFRRSLTTLSEASGEKMFSTAAILYLIGAILTIIAVGIIILIIAFILLTVAFFAMKPRPTPTPT